MAEDKSIQKPDIGVIADKGKKIYQRIKAEYDPKYHGKYLGIDTDTEEVFLGNTGEEVYKIASKKHPNKIFFLQKIGFDTAESIARYYKLIR